MTNHKSDRDLCDLTKRLNYPEYCAVEKADSLTRRLFDELGDRLDNLDSRQKKELILAPGFDHDQDIDNYLYSALAILSTALLSTKVLYRKNDINIDESKFLPDSELEMLRSSSLESKIRGEENPFPEGSDLCLAVAERFIEAIETQFYYLKDYDIRRSTPRQERYAKGIIKNISRYASFGVDIASVLKGFNKPVQAGAMETVMVEFSSQSEMYRMFSIDNHYQYFGDLLKLHAHIRGMNISESPYIFSDMIGDEISVVMDLVKIYGHAFNNISDFIISGKRRLLIPENNYVSFLERRKGLEDDWNSDWAECVSKEIARDERIEYVLEHSRSFFLELDSKLNAFGIPAKLSKKISDYLFFHKGNRSDPFYKGPSLRGNRLYQELHSKGSNYVPALREMIERVTGKEPNPVTYKFFSQNETTDQALGIEQGIYVASLDGKNIDIILEGTSKLSTEKSLDIAVEQFSSKNIDIYVRENIGICFLMDIDLTDNTFNPPYCVIEARDYFSDLADFDKMSLRLARLCVDLHETMHSVQIGSPLLWRDNLIGTAVYLCDEAIKQAKLGRLDVEVPFGLTNLTYFSSKKRKIWKEAIVSWIDEELAQSVSTGRIGSRIRNKGLYTTLWGKGKEFITDDGFITKSVLKDIPIENSQAVSYMYQIRSALERSDIPALEKLEREVKDYSNELSAIVETMAEAYCLLGMKEFIDHLPDKRYSNESKQKYYDSLYSMIERRGTLAQKYIDIASSSSSKRQMHRELAKHGMKYVQAIDAVKDEDPLNYNLMRLWYNPIDSYEAYDDMDELKHRADSNGFELEDLLLPMNSAKAILGVRYSIHLPLFMEVIEKYGSQRAFSKFLNAESIDEIKDLI